MPASDLNIFDAQFAVNQFSGNQSLLVQILGKFIQQYENFDTLLLEHFKQEDFHTAKQQVHTIKGVSGNLGMKALYLECKKLEVSLASKENNYTLDEFLLTLSQTLKLVQRYTAENSIQEIQEIAPQQVDKIALIAVLKRNEFISESKMQSYSQSLDLSPGELNELKQAIDNLDYAFAIQLLEG